MSKLLIEFTDDFKDLLEANDIHYEITRHTVLLYNQDHKASERYNEVEVVMYYEREGADHD